MFTLLDLPPYKQDPELMLPVSHPYKFAYSHGNSLVTKVEKIAMRMGGGLEDTFNSTGS
jgi:hypothetical protein